MPRKRFTNERIAFALRQAENGATVDEVCRKMGVSEATLYRWRKQFPGLNELRDERDNDLILVGNRICGGKVGSI